MSGRQRAGWRLALLSIVVAGVCVRLGAWQLDRLGERRHANAAIAERRNAAPVAVTDSRSARGDLWQRRVTVRGVADYDHERVWLGRTFDGAPGVAIVTPIRLADGSAVLVDRGFAPSPDARRVDLAATREGDTLSVSGLALRAPRGRGDADPRALADSFSYALAPIIVQWLPDGGAFSGSRVPVRRWPAASLDDGPHRSYAIQWFAFAAVALGGAVAVLRRSRQEGVGRSR
jgi:surfeit locus 1 family protein